MAVFSTKKYQRMAELLQRVQGEIEGEGGETLVRAEGGLEEAAREVGLALDVARLVDADTLVRTFAGGRDPDPGRCWAAAELLFLDGLLSRERGDGEGARDLLAKARALYGRIGEGLALPEGAVSAEERLRRLEALLGAS